MQTKSLLHDFKLIALAAVIGFSAREWSLSPTVQAQPATSPSEASRTSQPELAFQFGGTEIKDSLTIFNSANHTLYIYPAASGSSKINCAYSLHADRPGAPIERQNCDLGPLQ